MMGLYEEQFSHSHPEYWDDKELEHEDKEKLNYRKKVKRMLEEKLERKRLIDEFKDDFEDFNEDFDWSELDK